jgi:nickel superoxide dismutase
MMILNRAIELLDRVNRPRAARAHCDVPCGIYDPHTAVLGAQTVQKMVQQLMDLPAPSNGAGLADQLAWEAATARRIRVKEDHAELCKRELLILWTDYFKPEHLARFPDLHTTFWNAAKLCSRNKQNVDPEAAQQLLDAAMNIAQMFEQSKT